MSDSNLQTLLFTAEQQALILQLTNQLHENQANWLSGFFAGIGSVQQGENKTAVSSTMSNNQQSNRIKITILVGSRTGNGLSIA